MYLKICGMKYEDNIKQIAELKPQYMGFIFYKKSPRNVVAKIPFISKDIKKTGVFVNASLKEVITKIKKYDLQAVQLHGAESPIFCEELKQKQPNTELIKAFSVADTFNFSTLKPYVNKVDYFLFDTKGKLAGGNGIPFNWDLLKKYPFTKPFLLSGGIGMDEVTALKKLKKLNLPIYALDVNSKFETDYGLKNKELLQKFIQELT